MAALTRIPSTRGKGHGGERKSSPDNEAHLGCQAAAHDYLVTLTSFWPRLRQPMISSSPSTRAQNRKLGRQFPSLDSFFYKYASADGMLCSCSAEGETFPPHRALKIDFLCQDEKAARHVPRHPSAAAGVAIN